MDATSTFTVTAEHCLRALEESRAILVGRIPAPALPWTPGRATRAIQSILRVIVLVLALIGILFSAFEMKAEPQAWSVRGIAWILTFTAFFICAILLPRLQRKVVRPSQRLATHLNEWAQRTNERTCEAAARRMLRTAISLAPFEAHYEVQEGLLTYARTVKGQRQAVWTRKLSKYAAKGNAIQAQSVTVIFYRASALQAAAIVLHENPEWTESMLRAAGITVVGARAEALTAD